MGMVGITIEASINDKHFEVLHVLLLDRVLEEGEKYEIKMTKIDQECYLCRHFLLNHWSNVVDFGSIRFPFKDEHFDV